MSSHRLLYLPIEIKPRELLGKLWLASRAVERGWLVVMGNHTEVRRYAEENVPGVHVEISIPERKAALQEKLSRAGHRVVNLCEESVVYTDGEDYCLRKVGPTALKWTDLLFAAGETNAKHVCAIHQGQSEKVSITGNPRFDILRPELRGVYDRAVAAIRKRYGSFLLVNTNFGRANTFHPQQDYVEYLVRRQAVRAGDHAEFHRRFTDFKCRQLVSLREMLSELARSGKVRQIYVRPHPSENHDTWRQWGAPLGIEVKYEGDANAWAIAADAVLHPGCTTGLEALLLDRPTMSYVTEPDNEFVNVSDRISATVQRSSEVVAQLVVARTETGDARRDRYAAQREKLKPHIANIDLPYAADRILNDLDRLDVKEVEFTEAVARRAPLKRFWGWFEVATPQQSPLKIQKYGGLTPRDIQEPIAYWLRMGVLRHAPQLREIERGIFALW